MFFRDREARKKKLIFFVNSQYDFVRLYIYIQNVYKRSYNNKKSTARILFFFVGLSVMSLLIALFFGETINKYGIRVNTIPDLLLSAILTWFLILTL